MKLRTEGINPVGGQPDQVIHRNVQHRLDIVNTGNQGRATDQVRGQPVARPILGQSQGGEMSARRMAIQIDAPPVATNALRVLRSPDDAAHHLRNDGVQRDRGTQVSAQHHHRKSGIHQRFGQYCLLFLFADAPVAAVQVDHDRRAALICVLIAW